MREEFADITRLCGYRRYVYELFGWRLKLRVGMFR
jgi:hypothetical protein